MYQLTPIEAASAVNLALRFPHEINIRWNYFPLKGSNYRKYLKLKEHAEVQIKWLAVLSTDELFRVKEAIANKTVPVFFSDIIDTIYSVKKKGSHVVEILVGNGIDFPLFEYEKENALNNPGIPETFTTKRLPGSVLVRRPKKTVPNLPGGKLPPEALKILEKARIQAKD